MCASHHLWVVVFIRRQLYSFVDSCFHSRAVVFIHGCLFLLAGVHLCAQLPAFMAVAFVHGWWWRWCGVVLGCWWLVVVGPCGCLHSCVVDMWCCCVVMLLSCLCCGPCMWCEEGMTKGGLYLQYLENLDSDNGMRRHHLDDMAHLPHCLHHPSGATLLLVSCVCHGGCEQLFDGWGWRWVLAMLVTRQ